MRQGMAQRPGPYRLYVGIAGGEAVACGRAWREDELTRERWDGELGAIAALGAGWTAPLILQVTNISVWNCRGIHM